MYDAVQAAGGGVDARAPPLHRLSYFLSSFALRRRCSKKAPNPRWPARGRRCTPPAQRSLQALWKWTRSALHHESSLTQLARACTQAPQTRPTALSARGLLRSQDYPPAPPTSQAHAASAPLLHPRIRRSRNYRHGHMTPHKTHETN